MEQPTNTNKRNVGRAAVVYLGGGWVLVEAADFIVEKYDWDPELINYLIIFILFGLPSTIIYQLFDRFFSWKHLLSQFILVVLVLFTVVYFFQHPTSIDPSELRILKLNTHKKSISESLNSVAVLPFSNYLGDSEQDYLLAGMHDGLISEIGQLGSIHVLSRTTTLPYANSNKSASKICKELSVDAIIETSLTRIDTLIELRVRLIAVDPEETTLWSHSYHTLIGEMPNLYKEVTKNVALKLNDILLPKEMAKLTPKRVIKPGAYEAFLNGIYQMSLLTSEGFDNARFYFESSIRIDSAYAESYSGLAGLWGSMKQMSYVSTAKANPIIEEYLDRAYQLDSTSATVYFAHAIHYTWGTYEWKKADAYFKKSIDLNPNNAGFRSGYAHYLMIVNKWDEAWEHMNYAAELDPKNPWVIAFRAAMLFNDDKILSALKESEILKKIAPDHPMANMMFLMKYAQMGQHDLAIEELKKFIDRPEIPDIAQNIDENYTSDGFINTVQMTVDILEKEKESVFIGPIIILRLYEILNNKEKQLQWLQKLYEVKDPNLPYYAIRSNNPIQKEPIYIMIMEDIGLW